MLKKFGLCLLAILLVGGLLISCGEKKDPSDPPTSAVVYIDDNITFTGPGTYANSTAGGYPQIVVIFDKKFLGLEVVINFDFTESAMSIYPRNTSIAWTANTNWGNVGDGYGGRTQEQIPLTFTPTNLIDAIAINRGGPFGTLSGLQITVDGENIPLTQAGTNIADFEPEVDDVECTCPGCDGTCGCEVSCSDGSCSPCNVCDPIAEGEPLAIILTVNAGSTESVNTDSNVNGGAATLEGVAAAKGVNFTWTANNQFALIKIPEAAIDSVLDAGRVSISVDMELVSGTDGGFRGFIGNPARSLTEEEPMENPGWNATDAFFGPNNTVAAGTGIKNISWDGNKSQTYMRDGLYVVIQNQASVADAVVNVKSVVLYLNLDIANNEVELFKLSDALADYDDGDVINSDDLDFDGFLTAVGNPTYTVVETDGVKGIKVETTAEWGQGFDLDLDKYNFVPGDTIYVKGRTTAESTGQQMLINIGGWRPVQPGGNPQLDADTEFELTGVLTRDDITAIGAANPTAVRIRNNGGGASNVFIIEEIIVTTYRD